MRPDDPSDRSTVTPGPAAFHPATASPADERRRLAELLGRLLARHWLRSRATPGSSANGATDSHGRSTTS